MSPINDRKLLISTIKRLIAEVERAEQRGRKPKRRLKNYLALIITKSFNQTKATIDKAFC